MSRRIIGVAAAVALAAVGTVVLIAWVQSAEDRALAGEETVDVLVVSDGIARGTPVEDIDVDTQIVTERVPAKVQAAGSVDSLDDLEGRVAAVDLLPGEQLVSSRFAQVEDLEDDRDIEVPEELQEVTVSLTPERAVGGEIRPGDTVGFFASFDPFDIENVVLEGGEDFELEGEEESGNDATKTPNTTHLILHKVLVTNVQGDPTPDNAGDDEEGESSPSRRPAPGSNLLVTLAVDAAQAERIVFTAEFGHIWLSNEPETADESGTRIQHRGQVYFE